MPIFDAAEGRFENRTVAGRQLGERLAAYRGQPDVLVLGLPRGGVPVAHEVANVLSAPLDIYLVRKLGVPGREELAMGAIASGGTRILNRDVVGALRIDAETIEAVTEVERQELERRERLYRGERPQASLQGRTVLLVDDGLATGASMRAAVAAVRLQALSRIVVAVPVSPIETCVELRGEADDVVCLRTPEPFHGVGLWYEDFEPVSDDEIRRLLGETERGTGQPRVAG
jgi:putative phosphoribosyl transferase